MTQQLGRGSNDRRHATNTPGMVNQCNTSNTSCGKVDCTQRETTWMTTGLLTSESCRGKLIGVHQRIAVPVTILLSLTDLRRYFCALSPSAGPVTRLSLESAPLRQLWPSVLTLLHDPAAGCDLCVYSAPCSRCTTPVRWFRRPSDPPHRLLRSTSVR